jgi:hypothetical protein
MSDEARPVFRFVGEDVLVGGRRVNVRSALSAALGVELDDQALAEVLRGLRASMVLKDDIGRGLDEIEAAVTKTRNLLDGVGRPS